MRAVVLSFALTGLVVPFFACSSSSTPAAAANEPAGDSAACLVLASNYDDSCTVDSDCVLVPPGGTTCSCATCGNTTGALFCDFSSLSKSGAASFRAALTAAEEANNTDERFGSCPNLEITATCSHGACVSNACAVGGGTCVDAADASASCTENPLPCDPGRCCQ